MNEEKSGFTKQTKLEHMHRLQREGRWEQAVAYKEELRQGGQSNDVAWAAMLERFSPLPVETPSEPDADADGCGNNEREQTPEEAAELHELIEQFGDREVDVLFDLRWAYQNGDKDLSPREVPTPGAWFWLQFSKSHRPKFMELVFKHLGTQEKGKGEWKPNGGTARVIKVLDKIREGLKEEGISPP